MKENDEKRNKQESFPLNRNENDKGISPTESPSSVIGKIEERNRKVIKNIMDLEKWLKEEEEMKKKFQEKIEKGKMEYKRGKIFNKIFPKLMEFKNQYSDTIPEEKIGSTDKDKYYKVRSAFWQGISFIVENLWTYDLLSTELFIECKKIMEQRKEHKIENDLTREEDIIAINELIEKIIVFIDEKKYRLKYPPQDGQES